MVFCLDHGVHGKSSGSHRKCYTWLVCEGVSLSCVFPEEQRKVGCADDGGFGVFVGTNDVEAEAGDAMDVSAILKRSPKGASKGSGRSKDSEFVCWYNENK